MRLSELHAEIPWSGRVNTVAMHPRRASDVVVTTESGGLFKSTDGGLTWSHVDSLPAHHTNDLLYLPSEPDTLLVTTSADLLARPVSGSTADVIASGGGIWISRNGGDDWLQPKAAIPLANQTFSSASKCRAAVSAYGASVEPGTGRIYVATDCGVSLSSDLGRSWQHVEIHWQRAADRNPSANTARWNTFYDVESLGDGMAILGGHAGVWDL